jgi:hypothetical protein
MAVSVVNAYAATSDFVFVILERKVDLPTLEDCEHMPGHRVKGTVRPRRNTYDGKPTSAMRASPLLLTSNPVPAAVLVPGTGSRSCARSRAILLHNRFSPVSSASHDEG